MFFWSLQLQLSRGALVSQSRRSPHLGSAGSTLLHLKPVSAETDSCLWISELYSTLPQNRPLQHPNKYDLTQDFIRFYVQIGMFLYLSLSKDGNIVFRKLNHTFPKNSKSFITAFMECFMHIILECFAECAVTMKKYWTIIDKINFCYLCWK